MEIQALNITFLAKKDHQTNIEKKNGVRIITIVFTIYLHFNNHTNNGMEWENGHPTLNIFHKKPLFFSINI